MSSRGCPFLSFRRNQVVSMEQGQEQQLHDLDVFLSHVVDRLLSLLPPNSPTVAPQNPKPLLSLAFLSKLLDALLDVDAEFRPLLLVRGATPATAAPNSRPIADLLDRAVKSLDLCNGVSHSLHSLRHAHIASSALLLPRPHLLRAHSTLSKLLPFDAGLPRNQRTSSFGQREVSLRSLASSVSRNWSVHLAAPRGGEGGGGLAMAVYTMSAVLVVAMWALGASVPGQERGGQPMAPSKVESCGRGLMEVVEEAVVGGGGGALLERERAQEVAERAAELAEACQRLGPLEMQVREVFHQVVGQNAGAGGRPYGLPGRPPAAQRGP